ncbi:PREDICTED: putative F-box/LRR-repeat protein At3g58880 [Camelina sativa]|uniref:F-box/LRR-repeat protein At3g58880 n=1 Tax=Camelina sativa TaxID=90675 RepID=A0ABM1RL53_CAMSA|nr:PREDICTED: putative F-box/LRR-repeat protein At3g58880 [Camelina sativa]
MDWISSLPDDIICHILSFLSTKEAALTCLIAKRWRNLFAFSPNLRFEEKDFDYRNSYFGIPWSFLDFLEKSVVDSALINTWIRDVLSRGVLDLLHLDVIVKSVCSLPLEVFTCNTLVQLKLGRGFVIATVPEKASLPSLKTLFLDCVRFYNHHGCSFEALLSACHVLEELEIVGKRWEHLKWCRTVSSPTLQRLTIECEVSKDFYGLCRMSIQLLTLTCALVEAKLTLAWRRSPRYRINPRNLIKGLRNVEIMDLSSLETVELIFEIIGRDVSKYTYSPLKGACSMLSGYAYIQQPHIRDIDSSMDIAWQAMPVLLRNTPHLETLVIKGGLLHCVTDKCGDACICISRKEKGRSLASCPVKRLEIRWFEGITREMEMIKHFYDYFPCLKEMDIHVKDGRPRFLAPRVPDSNPYKELSGRNVKVKVHGSLHRLWTAQ